MWTLIFNMQVPLNSYFNMFIGPLSPRIHRALEWPQVLNSLLVCLCVGMYYANFLIIGWTLLLFSCPSFDNIINESIYHKKFLLVGWFHVEAVITQLIKAFIISGVSKISARTLGARSRGSKISDPSVLATRVAYVFIFYLCCLFSVCNVFTTPRAGP